MPGKRLVQFEKVPHTPEIQGRIGSRNFWSNLRDRNF
jgi:hypothetical protein